MRGHFLKKHKKSKRILDVQKLIAKITGGESLYKNIFDFKKA